MAHIDIDGDELIVTIDGADKLWALKSRLTVPLSNVRGATADPGIVKEPKGWRGPGTHLPGVLVAGTFHQDGEKIFWDVHDGDGAVVIELQGHAYARLIIEVADPADTVRRIEQALTAMRATG